MSANTWNFPCWQCQDGFPVNATRGNRGSVFGLGPGAVAGTTLPFTTTVSGVFSILVRSGWTHQDGNFQGIFSIGASSESSPGLYVALADSSTNPAARIFLSNGTTTRHEVRLGDEDGATWLADDKWYQIGFSANSSGLTYAVNGTNAPKVTTTTDSAGALGLGVGDERVWTTGPSANNGNATPATVTIQTYPTVVLGPSMWTSASMDFDDATVRGRIWDSEGNFKNPGEDGSLWFADTYSETTPDFYFVNGTPHLEKGSDGQTWTAFRAGSSTLSGYPAGLRKQYE